MYFSARDLFSWGRPPAVPPMRDPSHARQGFRFNTFLQDFPRSASRAGKASGKTDAR